MSFGHPLFVPPRLALEKSLTDEVCFATLESGSEAEGSLTSLNVKPQPNNTCAMCHHMLSADGQCRNCEYQPPSMLGKTLAERYILTESLGGGGSGDVYKGHDQKLKKLVAIKFLKSLNNGNRESYKFEQEARAASALSHNNIIAISDFGSLPTGASYVVMDYFPGKTLAELIEEGPLPASKAIPIFLEICAGIAHAHSKRVLHRDIKPSNIMVATTETQGASNSYSVRVIDFGGSLSLDDDGSSTLDTSPSTGAAFGSPYYVSPEQCNGEILDERSDIFSLGCTLYETLTGCPPYQGENVMATLYKRMNEPAAPLSNAAPAVQFPPSLERTVAKMLARNPKDRYQTVAQLQQDLSRQSAGGSELAISMSPHRRKQIVVLVLLAVTVSALSAATIWQLASMHGGAMKHETRNSLSH